MEQYQPILDNISRYTQLSDAAIAALTDVLELRKIKRRQFIVQPGFTCRYQFYVLEGAFRNYLISNEGQEHTIQFAIEDWFISDFGSYISQTPARLYVEALEDATVLCLSYEAAERLCEQFHSLERFFRLVAQKSFAYAQDRILSNLGKSAEERYLEFLDMYPQIVQRVPQYALASYLGMSAEFLSKIRKKLARKG